MNLKEFKQVKSKGGDKKIMKTKTKVIGGIAVILAATGITVGVILKRKMKKFCNLAMDYDAKLKQDLITFDTDEEKINFLNEKLEAIGGDTVQIKRNFRDFINGTNSKKVVDLFFRTLLIEELRNLGVDKSLNIVVEE